MNREKLLKLLRASGAKVIRHGGKHDWWGREDRLAAIPRHREIKLSTARAILKQLGINSKA